MGKIKFLIGSDGEFLITTLKGQLVSAQDLLIGGDNEFGVDGNKITAEVRPAPSENPIEGVHNIHKILLRKNNTDKRWLGFNLVSGSYKPKLLNDYPLGGHIHFGLKPDVIDPATACQCLDQYVGMASLLIEDKEEGMGRRAAHKGKYGQASDFRTKEATYGGFEYRTPSSWLTSPHVAASILCLAKTVMNELINNKHFEPNVYVNKNDFKEIPQEKLRKLFPHMWNDVTHMELYQDFKPQLDFLYYLVKNKLTWFPGTPMKEAWGIVDLKSPVSERKNRMFLDSIWVRYRQSIQEQIN